MLNERETLQNTAVDDKIRFTTSEHRRCPAAPSLWIGILQQSVQQLYELEGPGFEYRQRQDVYRFSKRPDRLLDPPKFPRVK